VREAVRVFRRVCATPPLPIPMLVTSPPDDAPTPCPTPQPWAGFKPGSWQTEVDVHDFIVANVTPYEGDGAFLASATARTSALWQKVSDLFAAEREQGVLASPVARTSEPGREQTAALNLLSARLGARAAPGESCKSSPTGRPRHSRRWVARARSFRAQRPAPRAGFEHQPECPPARPAGS